MGKGFLVVLFVFVPLSNFECKVGVINPPPDLRQIVDKTAMFVAKNGKKFEAK